VKESKFFGNFPRKYNFFTRVHDPQISNQIDVAEWEIILDSNHLFPQTS